MVEKAEEYSYSSARHYVLGDEDEIVTENPLYQEFGVTIEEIRYNYSEFLVDMGKNKKSVNEEFENFETPLGDEAFKDRLYKRKGKWYPRRRGNIRC